MCTTVLGFDPGSPVPVLFIGVRDEFLDRAWVGPGRHWPSRPDLVGGRDLLAGGTWLAVNPVAARAACVLNGRGVQADPRTRLSRGELPLLLATGEGGPGDLDLARYDPFHLLGATPDAARLWSWDGGRLAEQDLAPGLHIIVNSGLEGVGVDGPGVEQMRARVDFFRPLLDSAARPTPRLEPAEVQPDSAAAAWGDWLSLADGAGLDPADPRALLVRGNHRDQAWGSSSVSLVALGRAGVRYDFRATQGQGRTTWTTVLPAFPEPSAEAAGC